MLFFFLCTVSLKDWIEKNPSVLGDKVLEKWGTNLPFLFKVLSVAKALSIQAHPDKGLAEILHKKQPGEYKDDNHKPEMALALTEFEALCGFVSLQELKTVIQSVPEIVEVVGSSCADQVLHTTQEDGEEKVKDVLRSLFNHLMSASKSLISYVTLKLISRLSLKEQEGTLTDKEQLVLRLEKQYPGDIGLIASFLFNYVKLKPGEALYLGANEPHAYLQGECVECMATSDNVVRAGLTPKFRDVETLCSMLTYKQGPPEILTGNPSYPYTVKYLPPFDEFEIELCNLPQGASTVFSPVPGPSIFIVLSGEGAVSSASSKGLAVSEGDVLFASANTEIATETVKDFSTLIEAGQYSDNNMSTPATSYSQFTPSASPSVKVDPALSFSHLTPSLAATRPPRRPLKLHNKTKTKDDEKKIPPRQHRLDDEDLTSRVMQLVVEEPGAGLGHQGHPFNGHMIDLTLEISKNDCQHKDELKALADELEKGEKGNDAGSYRVLTILLYVETGGLFSLPIRSSLEKMIALPQPPLVVQPITHVTPWGIQLILDDATTNLLIDLVEASTSNHAGAEANSANPTSTEANPANPVHLS
ncbi:Mannose-6-phosphate isomerase 2 [Striga hermonthica]|uniref:Mannose-6-phosphate isomerase n=1 Tax=Striga hermonthica TaxID=68872 RepID=A0A9N7MQV8_STRHE|nr:Mannose-6-phosphate isomerase 2 [Striga hermonthica]